MKQLKIFGQFMQLFIQGFLYVINFSLYFLDEFFNLSVIIYTLENATPMPLCIKRIKKSDESCRNSSLSAYILILMYNYNFSLMAFTI